MIILDDPRFHGRSEPPSTRDLAEEKINPAEYAIGQTFCLPGGSIWKIKPDGNLYCLTNRNVAPILARAAE